MEGVDTSIQKLLSGQAVSLQEVDSKGTDPKSLERWQPQCKRNIGYIVMAVLFDDEGRICLVQEAKSSCYGKWYLPAGRMDPNENLNVAVAREVEEEAGLKFEPTTLVGVEMQGCTWYRFTYIGNVVGGKLKTEAEADKESIQAQWFTYEQIKNKEIKLRDKSIVKMIKKSRRYNRSAPTKCHKHLLPVVCAHTHLVHRPVIVCSQETAGAKDIMPMLDVAIQYRKSSENVRHPSCLPAIVSHTQLTHRPLLVKQSDSGDVSVLVNLKGGAHVPSSYIHPSDFTLIHSLRCILKAAFGEAEVKLPELLGFLSVEYCGVPEYEHDGMVFTTLWLTKSDSNGLDKFADAEYSWYTIKDQNINSELKSRLAKGRTVPLFMLM